MSDQTTPGITTWAELIPLITAAGGSPDAVRRTAELSGVSPGEIARRLAAADTPGTDLFTRVKPGTIDLRVLDQEQVWVDATGQRIPISDLTLQHAAAVLRHLDRHAALFRRLHQRARWFDELMLALSCDDYTDPPSLEPAISAEEWMRTTPLYQAVLTHLDQSQPT